MLSTHLTHTETLYKRSFEVVQDKENSKQKKKNMTNQLQMFHYYATQLSNIEKDSKDMHPDT